MPHSTTLPQSQSDSIDRSDRINKLFARGLETTRRMYEAGKYLEDYNNKVMDFGIVGSSLTLAHALLRQGDPASLERACEIIEEVINTQERHPLHPHRGNWPRYVGDKEVTDLNSAPFILRWLIPLLVKHGYRLPEYFLSLCRRTLILALEELERMDISAIYTNIHLMTLFALIVGGEWLENEHFQEIGKTRWNQWVHYTVMSGAPREYNSATYLGMDLTVLAKIFRLAKDPVIKLQANLLYERLWLHVALHIHRPTRQLAGPHSRCYWSPMLTGRERLTEILWRETGWSWLLESSPYEDRPTTELPVNLELALTDFWLPTFVYSWLESQRMVLPYEVRETASRREGYDLTTYHTQSYALGSASRTYSTGTGILAIEQMANHMLLHYEKPDQPGGWGMMYSRYVVNNQHLGTLGSFAFRTDTNFFDQGNFAGAQLRNKAIGLYSLLPLFDTYVDSLKTVIAFQAGSALERVYVDGRPININQLPRPIQPGKWVVVEDGKIYVGLHPLETTCLSREAPMVLERGPLGELWLAIYNYKGISKRFWEYASLGGAYWQGNIKAGFVVEVAQKSEFGSAAAFLDYLTQARIEETDNEFVRTVIYRSDGDELALSYDLWNTEPKARRFNGAAYAPPNLASPLGVQGDSGELRVGNARLVTRPQQVWLVAQEVDPGQRTWIAVNPEDRTTPLKFETLCGVITAEAWGLGRLEWQAPAGGAEMLIVDTLRKPVGLQVPEGVQVVYINR